MFNGQIIKYLHNLETIYFFHIKIDICFAYYIMANYYMYLQFDHNKTLLFAW